jgi:hypothetical protein
VCIESQNQEQVFYRAFSILDVIKLSKFLVQLMK